ncbi:unnamed protein product, partial [Rotaria magnacalcarata]
EEREELEVLNSFRERQLEIKHRQLLQELESLQTARETTNSSTAATNPPARSFGNIYSISEQCAIDSNFKDLM